MIELLNQLARFFATPHLVPVTQETCAKEVIRQDTMAESQLRTEYAQIFKSDLRRHRTLPRPSNRW